MCGISRYIFTNISIYSNNKNYIDHEQLISIFIDYPKQWMNETKLQLKKEKMIRVRGAKMHNLKNINIDIPSRKFVVFTGLSGSGKSSLAFDTLYAEGQRRYVRGRHSCETVFRRLDKPKADKIEGLAPAIAIEQKVNSTNPRSTVGTTTEIYDYLKLLLHEFVKHTHQFPIKLFQKTE